MRQLARVTMTMRDLDGLKCTRSVRADSLLLRRPQFLDSPAAPLRELLGFDNIGK
jgi:hypothetical protein